VKDRPLQRAESKIQIIKGKGEIKNLVYNNKEIEFNYKAKENSKLRINTIYWSGWRVFVNNVKADISYNNPKGVIEFDVEKGEHQIRAEFNETPLRMFADLISITSLVTLMIVSIKSKIKTQKFNSKLKSNKNF
jgi:hypothetical protein